MCSGFKMRLNDHKYGSNKIKQVAASAKLIATGWIAGIPKGIDIRKWLGLRLKAARVTIAYRLLNIYKPMSNAVGQVNTRVIILCEYLALSWAATSVMVNINACAVIKPVAIPPNNVRIGFTMGKSLISEGISRNR
tara:strand:+ start:221 stop:628 length:408 start_codon:yes stop_codon:yes gene_type:complete